MRVLNSMEYGIGIAGLSDIIGVVAVTACIVAVGVMLQRMPRPKDRLSRR
ncbi:MAG TPA: hypothetical protein VH189_11245 [Rhizomicrobium sp.]|nr:hypothetical protein [Rhizomicrobium sp.]